MVMLTRHIICQSAYVAHRFQLACRRVRTWCQLVSLSTKWKQELSHLDIRLIRAFFAAEKRRLRPTSSQRKERLDSGSLGEVFTYLGLSKAWKAAATMVNERHSSIQYGRHNLTLGNQAFLTRAKRHRWEVSGRCREVKGENRLVTSPTFFCWYIWKNIYVRKNV